jgi:hypothetical protein
VLPNTFPFHNGGPKFIIISSRNLLLLERRPHRGEARPTDPGSVLSVCRKEIRGEERRGKNGVGLKGPFNYESRHRIHSFSTSISYLSGLATIFTFEAEPKVSTSLLIHEHKSAFNRSAMPKNIVFPPDKMIPL